MGALAVKALRRLGALFYTIIGLLATPGAAGCPAAVTALVEAVAG